LSLLILFFVFVVFNKKLLHFFVRPLHHYLVPDYYKNDFKSISKQFYSGITIFFSKHVTHLVFLCLTLICWFCWFFQVYLLSESFNLEIMFYDFFVIVPLMVIVESLPISLFGIGTRDWTLITVLSFYGVGAEMAVSFSLGVLSLYLVVAILGYFSLVRFFNE